PSAEGPHPDGPTPPAPAPPPGGPAWAPEESAPPDHTRPAWLPGGGAAPPGTDRPEPPPAWRGRPLLVLLALALVAALAGTGLALRGERRQAPSATSVAAAPSSTTAAPTTTRPPVAATRTPAAVRAVQADVAELRGLRFRHPVPVTIESPAKLARRLLRTLDAETDEADEARQGRALAVLGELPLGTDLPWLRRQIQAESVLGFYLPGRPPKGRLFVRSSRGLDPYAKVVLAHELTHAVTDQHYDLTRSDRLAAATGRDDEQTAYAALVEGDATLVMQRYLRERLTAAERVAAGQASAGDRTPRRDAAPAVIREPMLFPYREGLRFVFLLYQAGGWAAVDRAYRDPPTSTEQILHPDKYLARRDRPQQVTVPDLSARLGGGWRSATQIGFGELDLRLLLETKLPQATAEAAAAGWDGARLRSFERGGRTALVLRTVWDSTAEAAEFCTAATRWATARFGAPTAPRRWSGRGQHTALRCQGPRAALLSAPDQQTFQRLLAATPRP
ncbi:MAG TPA: hypothetical protein VF880_02675, partial [Actinomycetes bacterium]